MLVNHSSRALVEPSLTRPRVRDSTQI